MTYFGKFTCVKFLKQRSYNSSLAQTNNQFTIVKKSYLIILDTSYNQSIIRQLSQKVTEIKEKRCIFKVTRYKTVYCKRIYKIALFHKHLQLNKAY